MNSHRGPSNGGGTRVGRAHTSTSTSNRRVVARAVSVVFVLCGTLAGLAGPAAAATMLAAGPASFPSGSVGQTGLPAVFQVDNASSAPDNAGLVVVNTMTLVPSCSNVIQSCSGGVADPGVYQLSATGVGEAGTACASQIFKITIINAATGEVSFVPSAPPTQVALTAPGTQSSRCRIDFTVNVLKMPSADSSPATPGVQTNQVGFARATNTTTGNSASATGALTATVTKASPTVVTMATGSISVGGQISDSASLSGLVSPGGVGTITFNAFGPGNPGCIGPPLSTTVVPVVNNGVYSSPPVTTTAAGTYRFVATYSGDANNNAVATSCADAGEAVTVTQAVPTLTSTASSPVPIGGSINDTATLTRGFSPTGTITFNLFGPNNATCAGPVTATFTVAVNGTGNYPSPSFVVTQPGTYRFVASYSGDANNFAVGPTACSDPGESVSIRANPQITTVASASVPVGGTIRDTAAITGGLAPTGTVTFNLFGPADPTCAGPAVFTTTVPVAGGGAVSADFTATGAGTYRFKAAYSGDPNNSPAGPTTCGDPAEAVVVTRISPAVVTHASAPVVLGGTIFDTATLSGGAAPTGTITFSLFGPSDFNCAIVTQIVTVPIAGNGNYSSPNFFPNATGTYRYQARYSGDANNNPAGPTACSDPAEAVSVIPASPLLTTRASAPVAVGEAIHDTATLAGGFNLTGTITFSLFGPSDSICAAAPPFIAIVPVAGNGNYDSSSFVSTQPGTYRFVATYSGDANNRAVGPTTCSDPAEQVTVKPASTRPLLGDFNGDGKTDIAVWRPSNGTWYVRGISETVWGQPGDIPVPADYNGDGRADIAVYRPSNGTWYVRGISETQFGLPGDIPVVGDYAGDIRADIAVWRPSSGTWYVRGVSETIWGQSGDVPVSADYSGDGKADIAVYRPSNGTWYVRGISETQFGLPTDVAVPGDFAGDARADIAVWRPSNGTWYVRGFSETVWGVATDVPV